MKRELKKQIKQDELVTGLDKALRWLRAHEREARVTAIVLVAAAAGWMAVRAYRGGQAGSAEKGLAAALEVYHAPVAGDPGAEEAGVKVFATAAEKYQQACPQLAEVHRRFGSHDAGRRARYYEGLCRIELGQLDEAEKALREVAARRDREALEPAMARLELADLARRRGQLDQALSAYRQLVDEASLALPRDHVLMTLSATLEEAKRLPEARASYQRLADEFPDSVYAGEARRRAEYLKEPAAG